MGEPTYRLLLSLIVSWHPRLFQCILRLIYKQKVMAFFLHKANFVMFWFKFSDPHVEMKLLQAYWNFFLWQFSLEDRLSWAQSASKESYFSSTSTGDIIVSTASTMHDHFCFVSCTSVGVYMYFKKCQTPLSCPPGLRPGPSRWRCHLRWYDVWRNATFTPAP